MAKPAYGNIYIERGTGNALQFYGNWEFDWEFTPEIQHLLSDTHISYDLGARTRTVMITDARFTSTDNLEDTLATIDSLQNSGTMTLELKVESADYFEIDGSSTSLEVMCLKIKGCHPLEPGYATPKVYGVKLMIFEQGG